MKNDMPDMKPASPFYRDHVKRIIDLLIAIPVLIVAAIPMALTAIAVKLDSPGPVLFKQDRLGKDGKVFKMLKFRSMCVGAAKTGSGVYSGKGDSRVTRVGKFIRATSLDELPQLFNIFKGDMTFVGPRPPLESEAAQYTDYQRQRLLVKQGLTCYWQCSGRNEISFAEWVEMDLRYIRERSLWTDLKILFMTVPAVFSGRGAE